MDVLKNNYQVTALLKDGSTLPLDGAITRLSWQEAAEEVAQRAILELAQTRTDRGWLNALLPLLTVIRIAANGGEVFRGVVWEWEYASGSSRTITLTCYDPFIYAQNSRTFAYFPAGKTTKDIVTKVCSDNGIRCSYLWKSARHDKTVYRGTAVADQILDALEEGRKRLGERPVCTFSAGTLTVQGEGYNQTVYVFHAAESTIATSERLTMDGLVTQVAIYGAETEDDRRAIAAVVPGRTEFGTLQDVVLMSSSSTLAEARKEAQTILKEQGSPRRDITAEAPDVPEIRKGWKIRMEAGSLLGYYIVMGITHNATDRSMVMELRPV